ncbi:uncharacterized protein LOC120903873 isoform X2 [Anopheles arabiensis]|uniref:uncharacterized protein LOC120903873 isoform X2 n=1 Tax=Anopheles arabiensis TaxID=7173 RepID=UPI001AAD2FB2|nr:uncharacterized protein LOC120903873 isoform X2 [Anopheles arabiensis]
MAKRSGKLYRQRDKLLEQLSAEYDAEAGPSRVFSSTIDNISQTGRVSSLFESHLPDSEHPGREDPAIIFPDRYGKRRCLENLDEDTFSNEDYFIALSSDSETDENDVNMETVDTNKSKKYHNCENHEDVKDCLRHFAITRNLPRDTVNEMLEILRSNTNMDLPKDCRTLLKTSSTPCAEQFTIQFSVDGLPLHKSGRMQVWPILMKVEEVKNAPIMMVAAFCGTEKPRSVEEYLRQLVEEANKLYLNGVRIGDKKINFQIRAFIADSPARAFIKSTCYFNAVHGCLRCTCVGVYHPTGHKVVFDCVGAPLRTDDGFRDRECIPHHQPLRSPLEDLLHFDMIEHVPTSDRLHLIDLGVTRKIICGIWIGKFVFLSRLSDAQKEFATNFFTALQLPSEINRKIHDPYYMHKWKGTQFRTFLHYCSVIVMKELVPERVYNHYLLYFCGITIFSTKFHRKHWKTAEVFLNVFVRNFGAIYGSEHVTSNVHNLQHIAKDVENLGPLDNFSSYDFENYLGILKRSVRSGFKCGVQIAARSEERANVHSPNHSDCQYPRIVYNGNGIQLTANFLLRASTRDEWFLTKRNEVVKFMKLNTNPSLVVVGMRYEYVTDVFHIRLIENDEEIELSSADIYIYEADDCIPTAVEEFSLHHIRCKLIAVTSPANPGLKQFVPLLHTFVIDS